MTILGTRPEVIKLSRVISQLDQHTQHVLVHTGQNYDFELNEIFFRDLGIRAPDHFLDAVAEKGALPCYRTLYGMEYPETVKGWRNDENHQPFHEVDMSRWPVIFGSNNLRGAPTAALGLGALALEGHDDRARLWLRAAESSARSLFQLFSRDGSFFEGLSYSDYTLRTILSFCDAHHRIKGTVDWAESMNFSGFLDYIVTMQAGKNKDGNPDIVNFSDANKSIYPCVSSWIERETGDPRAQYITEYFSTPGYFLDFLWYRTERPMECPPVSLKNRCNELEWVICRSGWQEEDAVLAFRSGFPANHEHSDRNSFFCKIYGERLLTDHFGAAYNRNDPKWSLRLTQGHNAVLIDGKGQQYHNGEEGVNESQSEARVVRFRDGGEKAWWVSDATPAYRLVNPDIVRVVRTVAFAKPDIVILFDQVVLDSTEAKVEVRFFPDNRDDSAEISVAGSTFHISRPRAELFAGVASPGALELGTARLSPADPLPGYEPDPRCKTAGTEFGNYPFVSVHTSPGKTHTIVTAFTARKGRGGVAPEINLEKNDRGWFCQVAGFRCDIDTREDYPAVFWS